MGLLKDRAKWVKGEEGTCKPRKRKGREIKGSMAGGPSRMRPRRDERRQGGMVRDMEFRKDM